MSLGKKLNQISLVILVSYIGILFVGKYLAIPLWDIFYTVEFNPIEIALHLKIALNSLIILIPSIICSIFLFSYSKRYFSNSIFWALLGLLKGPFAVILFLLVVLYNKENREIKLNQEKFEGIIIWLVIFFLSKFTVNGIEISYSNYLKTILETNSELQYTLMTKIDEFFGILFTILINISVGIWIYRKTLNERLYPWIWLIFGLCGGLFAPIIFYIFKLIKSSEFNKYSNQHNL